MAKTIVIKGANFATNKIETVSFDDDIPCTGLTLNKATATITSIGATEKIAATPTPSNTTDTVSWSTSDQTVATVSNGVVTAVGLGVATITATCGQQTATCAVTVEAGISFDKAFYPGAYISGSTLVSGGTGIIEIMDASSTSASYGVVAKTTGVKYLHGKFNNERAYPVILPGNTAKLKITRANTTVTINAIRCIASSVSPNGKPEQCVHVANIPVSDIVFNNNVAIVNIPTNTELPAVDSFVVMLTKENGTEFLSTDFDVYTFEALMETE